MTKNDNKIWTIIDNLYSIWRFQLHARANNDGHLFLVLHWILGAIVRFTSNPRSCLGHPSLFLVLQPQHRQPQHRSAAKIAQLVCKDLRRFKDFLTHFIVSIAFFKFRMLKFSIGKYLQSCRRWGCSEMQRETWRHGLGQQIEPLACQVPLKHCVRFKHWAQLLLPVASACMYQVHNRLVEGRRQHSWLLARGHHVAC